MPDAANKQERCPTCDHTLAETAPDVNPTVCPDPFHQTSDGRDRQVRGAGDCDDAAGTSPISQGASSFASAEDETGPPSEDLPTAEQERWTIFLCPRCHLVAEYAAENGCCQNCDEWLGGEGTGDEDRRLAVEVVPASALADKETELERLRQESADFEAGMGVEMERADVAEQRLAAKDKRIRELEMALAAADELLRWLADERRAVVLDIPTPLWQRLRRSGADLANTEGEDRGWSRGLGLVDDRGK